MKSHRKSTMIAYWVLRVLAISCALLLFSVTGIVALQPVTQATASNTTTAGTTLSPVDTAPSPTPVVPTDTPNAVPTATPTAPAPTAKPTQVPTKAPTKPPVPGSTPIPTPTTATTLPPGATPVSTAALGGALPPPAAKGTPKAQPSPTPPGSPTPGTASTQLPTINGNTPTTPKTQSGSGGFTAMIKPLIGPITGVSTTILLAAAALLGLMFWRKRTAAQSATSQLQSSSAQASAPWMNQQTTASNGYQAQPNDATVAQNRTMVPFAMQSIAQYSPLLGALDSSNLDAPVPPPTSEFRPLALDFPHILEVNTDKTAAAMSPSAQQGLSPSADPAFQSALPIASTPLSPILDVLSPSTPAQTPIPPPAQHNASTAYAFPPHDSSLENLIHQAQMGIFALPGKEA